MSESFEVKGYRAEGRLGAGSQGETFAAVEVATGQRVALKRLRFADAPDWKSIELFEREGTTLAGLSHPGIARHIESFAVRGDDGGETFHIVQERIDGESLDRRIERGVRLGPNELSVFIREMAVILTFIHGRTPAVIHRDIKPSNIMVRTSGPHAGRYVLIDFGTLQLVMPKVGMDGGSTIVGTSGYMPPEQLLGRTGPASDLYALGATAVHLLTGVHPSRTPLKRLRLDWRANLPRGLVVPESLAACLDKLLEPAVEDRFAHAADVATALDACPKLPAARRSRAVATPTEAQKRARVWAVAILVFMAATYAVVFFGWFNHQPPRSDATFIADSREIVAELRDIPPLPARVIVDPRLARTLGPEAEKLRSGLVLTPRTWNGRGASEYVSASFLLQWHGEGAVSEVKTRCALVNKDGETLASRDFELAPAYAAPLHAGDFVGIALNFQTPRHLEATAVVVAILEARMGASEPSLRTSIDVQWTVPPPEGVALAFEVLSISETVTMDRRSHRPRVAVKNVGTLPIVTLRLIKELDDPAGQVPPQNNSTWVIATDQPSLLPGETRVFGAWSWEDAALSDWRLVVGDVRAGMLEVNKNH